MRRLLVLVAALAFAPSAQAAKTPSDAIKAGLQKAVDAGWIQPSDAARDRGILARANGALPKLGGSRHANLQQVVKDVAARSGQFTAPRALVLFGMLDENVRYFGAQGPPAPQADVVGADKVVYRYFPGHGLQFHPLANFAALNSHLAAGRLDSARTLAAALQARAVAAGGASVWEYEWPFGGGKAPWTSGMAQAVAAQALARAGQRLGDETLTTLSHDAFRAIPGKLDMRVAQGTWVRLYSFSRMAVFNAQLQTTVSLRDYADFTGDTDAGALSDAMRAAVQKALPAVDTGYWTRYAIDGAEESRGYHDFVITILGRLRSQTKDPFWSDLATRFKAYETQPTLFRIAAPPVPATSAKKGKAKLAFSLWLSKSSTVSLSAAGQARRLSMTFGWHRLTWTVPRAKAGLFPVSLRATPIAGPSASATLPPLAVLARAPAGLGPLAVAAGSGSAGAPATLVIGAAENDVLTDPAGRLAQATAAGFRAIRIAIPWSPGQAGPDPALTAAAQQAASLGVRLYAEVYPASPELVPTDDARRAEFAGYLRSLAAALPQLRDFVVGSQVNDPAFWPQTSRTAADYVALLGASYDALKSVDPTTQVIGGALDSQLAPGTFVLSLGQAYRRSGRITPIMDALALQPLSIPQSEAPATVHPSGATTIADYPRLVANLKRAFDNTAQPGAALPIVYDGYGVEATPAPEKASLYTGAETDAVPEATQGSYYAQALQLAVCQPTVSALLYGDVVDDGDLARSQQGVYYPDGSQKSDFSAVQTAIAAAQTGSLPACAGAKPVSAPPTATVADDGRSVQLACLRECAYVVALERDDVPVRAASATAAAGATVTVTAPVGVLAGDRLVVHVASTADPTDAVVLEGDPVAG
jgi:hypothetical protein